MRSRSTRRGFRRCWSCSKRARRRASPPSERKMKAGTWDGDEQTRISMLEAMGTSEHPPAYFDLELAAWKRSANLRQKVRLAIDHESQVRDISARLVLSSHDFGGRARESAFPRGRHDRNRCVCGRKDRLHREEYSRQPRDVSICSRSVRSR